MLGTIILFLIALLSLAGFLGWKLSLLEKGRLVPHPHPIHKSVKEDVYYVRRELSLQAKRYFKLTIFTAGKIWVITTYLIEKKARKHFPRIFPKKPEGVQEPSFFLATITEYKTRMKRFKKRIIEEDTQEAEGESFQ